MYNLCVLRKFSPTRLSETKRDPSDQGGGGIAFYDMVGNWLRHNDLPTFFGLFGLLLTVVAFYALTPVPASEKALYLSNKVGDFATGATFFHILISQLEFAFANKDIIGWLWKSG